MANFVSPNQIQIPIRLVLLVRPDTCDDAPQPCFHDTLTPQANKGITRVRNSNLGLWFSPFKCCVSRLSVDRFGNNFEGWVTLGQVKSSPNFCSFGPQRAEKSNIWRWKNTNVILNSRLWSCGARFSSFLLFISIVSLDRLSEIADCTVVKVSSEGT